MADGGDDASRKRKKRADPATPADVAAQAAAASASTASPASHKRPRVSQPVTAAPDGEGSAIHHHGGDEGGEVDGAPPRGTRGPRRRKADASQAIDDDAAAALDVAPLLEPNVAWARVKIHQPQPAGAADDGTVTDNLHVPIKTDTTLATFRAYLVHEGALPENTAFRLSYTDYAFEPPERFALSSEARFLSFKGWALSSAHGGRLAVDAVIQPGHGAAEAPSQAPARPPSPSKRKAPAPVEPPPPPTDTESISAPSPPAAPHLPLAAVAAKDAIEAAADAVHAEAPAASHAPTRKAASGCGVCSAPDHHAFADCPWIQEGNKAKLQARLDELKDLQQRKKKHEREAQKALKSWMKTNLKAAEKKKVGRPTNAEKKAREEAEAAKASQNPAAELDNGDQTDRDEQEEDDDDELAADLHLGTAPPPVPSTSNGAASKHAESDLSGCLICSSTTHHDLDGCPLLTEANKKKVRTRLIKLKELPERDHKLEKRLGAWVKAHGLSIPRVRRAGKGAGDPAHSTIADGDDNGDAEDDGADEEAGAGDASRVPAAAAAATESDGDPSVDDGDDDEGDNESPSEEESDGARDTSVVTAPSTSPAKAKKAPATPASPPKSTAKAWTASTPQKAAPAATQAHPAAPPPNPPYTKLSNLSSHIGQLRNGQAGHVSDFTSFNSGHLSGGGDAWPVGSQATSTSSEHSVVPAPSGLPGGRPSLSAVPSRGANHGPAAGDSDESIDDSEEEDDDEDDDDDSDEEEEDTSDDDDAAPTKTNPSTSTTPTGPSSSKTAKKAGAGKSPNGGGGSGSGSGGGGPQRKSKSNVPPEKRLGGSASKKVKKPKNALAGL